jgi:hypothetical protein
MGVGSPGTSPFPISGDCCGFPPVRIPSPGLLAAYTPIFPCTTLPPCLAERGFRLVSQSVVSKSGFREAAPLSGPHLGPQTRVK